MLFSFLCSKQVLHPQSMRPAREGDIPVRVKNSYNPKAPGTLITKQREMDQVCSRLIRHIFTSEPHSSQAIDSFSPHRLC